MPSKVTGVSLVIRPSCTFVTFYRNGQQMYSSHRSYVNPSRTAIQRLARVVTRSVTKKVGVIDVFADGWVAVL